MTDLAVFLALAALTMIGYYMGREVERDQQRRRNERRRAHRITTTTNPKG
jgi:hypothetical protein